MSRFYVLILAIAFVFSACKKDKVKPEDTPHVPPVIEGKIYVANEMDGSVSVINAATNKVIKTIYMDTDAKSGLMTHNIQVSPDGKTVWVTVMGHTHEVEEEVVVLDAIKDSFIMRKEMGIHIHLAHVVLSSDGNFAYVTATNINTVYEIDTKTYKITRTFMLGDLHEPHGMRYFSGKLYIANLKYNGLSVINLADGRINDIALGSMAVQTAVTPNGKYIFVSLFSTKEIARMDLSTMEIQKFKLPEGAQGPIQLYPTPDSRQLYICDQGVLLDRPANDKVYVMDIETGAITNAISSGLAPHGVVLSKGGEYAYVTNMMSDNVSVIETSTQKTITKIVVGSAPNGISFRYNTGGMP